MYVSSTAVDLAIRCYCTTMPVVRQSQSSTSGGNDGGSQEYCGGDHDSKDGHLDKKTVHEDTEAASKPQASILKLVKSSC